jgi:hypothetical protein
LLRECLLLIQSEQKSPRETSAREWSKRLRDDKTLGHHRCPYCRALGNAPAVRDYVWIRHQIEGYLTCPVGNHEKVGIGDREVFSHQVIVLGKLKGIEGLALVPREEPEEEPREEDANLRY